MFSLNLILIALLELLATHALALPKDPKWHDPSRNSVPMSESPQSQNWYQPLDHPVHSLFKRTQDDGAVIYAPVGSPGQSI
jgi:hypothetical protein